MRLLARQDMEFSVPSSAPPRWAITAGVFPCLADMGSADCADDGSGKQTRAPRTASKEAGFIRKVIICEPPFEAVQLNIQYL